MSYIFSPWPQRLFFELFTLRQVLTMLPRLAWICQSTQAILEMTSVYSEIKSDYGLFHELLWVQKARETIVSLLTLLWKTEAPIASCYHSYCAVHYRKRIALLRTSSPLRLQQERPKLFQRCQAHSWVNDTKFSSFFFTQCCHNCGHHCFRVWVQSGGYF